MDSVTIGSAELSAFQSIACDLQPLLQLDHELAFHSHHDKAWFTRSLVETHPEWIDFLLEESQEEVGSLAVLLDRFFRCYYVRPGTPNAQLSTKAFSAIRKRDRAPVFHFLLVASGKQRALFRTAVQAMLCGQKSRMESAMDHIANQDLKSVSHTLKQQCRGDGVVERIDQKDERGKAIRCGLTVQRDCALLFAAGKPFGVRFGADGQMHSYSITQFRAKFEIPSTHVCTPTRTIHAAYIHTHATLATSMRRNAKAASDCL